MGAPLSRLSQRALRDAVALHTFNCPRNSHRHSRWLCRAGDDCPSTRTAIDGTGGGGEPTSSATCGPPPTLDTLEKLMARDLLPPGIMYVGRSGLPMSG